jgi:histone H3/H4
MAKPVLPIAPIARIVKNAGAERISEEAKKVLADSLESCATATAEKAIAYARHAGRKTVTAEDIKLASEFSCHG